MSHKIDWIKALFITVVGLIGALTAITPAPAETTIRYVAPGGNCGGATPCYSVIQTAVSAATNGDEIRIAAGTYSQTSTGSGVTAAVRIVDKKVAIRGGYSIADWTTARPETNITRIDPQQNGVGIYITYQADIGVGQIDIAGVTITNGDASEAVAGTDSGGGVYVDRTTHVQVTVRQCHLYENSAEDGSGGGIWSARSDNLTVEACDIHDNDGDGVTLTYGANPVIIDSRIADNAGHGIAVYTASSDGLTIADNTITGNDDSGIRVNTATGGSITDNVVLDNHTTNGGGGMDLTGVINEFLVSGNVVRNNSALQGGGIDINGSIAVINNNIIESNTTTAISNGGGGLYLDAGASGAYVLVSNNQVVDNTTSNLGGGMVVLGFADVLGNTVDGNHAQSGGGIVATMTGRIGRNTIRNNSAQLGGGLRVVNPTGLIVDRNLIHDNTATNGEGGGINIWGGFFMDVLLDGNRVVDNRATTKGGGVYLECPPNVDPVDVANTVIAHNMAATGSGLYATVCDLNLAYSTVVSNRGETGDGVGIYLRDPFSGSASYTVENSVIAQQTTGVYVESGFAGLDATFWGAGAWANTTQTSGTGTITTGTSYSGDPRFVDPVARDFHILETSPLIDNAVDTWVNHDLDGDPRPAGASDIGADEYSDLEALFLPIILR